MVVDNRDGMDSVQANLQFLLKNDLKVGWLSQPDPFSPGTGQGSDRKQDDDGSQSEPTVATVARAHELSLGTLEGIQPPRSVLNATMDEKTVEIEVAMGRFIQPAIAGEIKARRGMELLGLFIVDLAKQRYQSQEGFVPLSDRRKKQKTRAGKAGDKARLNFGQEVNSLRFQIGGAD